MGAGLAKEEQLAEKEEQLEEQLGEKTRMLRRMARGALQDTVLLLLSDHGTHGIWCAPCVMCTRKRTA